MAGSSSVRVSTDESRDGSGGLWHMVRMGLSGRLGAAVAAPELMSETEGEGRDVGNEALVPEVPMAWDGPPVPPLTEAWSSDEGGYLEEPQAMAGPFLYRRKEDMGDQGTVREKEPELVTARSSSLPDARRTSLRGLSARSSAGWKKLVMNLSGKLPDPDDEDEETGRELRFSLRDRLLSRRRHATAPEVSLRDVVGIDPKDDPLDILSQSQLSEGRLASSSCFVRKRRYEGMSEILTEADRLIRMLPEVVRDNGHQFAFLELRKVRESFYRRVKEIRATGQASASSRHVGPSSGIEEVVDTLHGLEKDLMDYGEETQQTFSSEPLWEELVNSSKKINGNVDEVFELICRHLEDISRCLESLNQAKGTPSTDAAQHLLFDKLREIRESWKGREESNGYIDAVTTETRSNAIALDDLVLSVRELNAHAKILLSMLNPDIQSQTESPSASTTRLTDYLDIPRESFTSAYASAHGSPVAGDTMESIVPPIPSISTRALGGAEEEKIEASEEPESQVSRLEFQSESVEGTSKALEDESDDEAFDWSRKPVPAEDLLHHFGDLPLWNRPSGGPIPRDAWHAGESEFVGGSSDHADVKFLSAKSLEILRQAKEQGFLEPLESFSDLATLIADDSRHGSLLQTNVAELSPEIEPVTPADPVNLPVLVVKKQAGSSDEKISDITENADDESDHVSAALGRLPPLTPRPADEKRSSRGLSSRSGGLLGFSRSRPRVSPYDSDQMFGETSDGAWEVHEPRIGVVGRLRAAIFRSDSDNMTMSGSLLRRGGQRRSPMGRRSPARLSRPAREGL